MAGNVHCEVGVAVRERGLVPPDPLDGTVDWIEVVGRLDARNGLAELLSDTDDVVGQAGQECGLPVGLQALGIHGVEECI
jgi:hypothetical protein